MSQFPIYQKLGIGIPLNYVSGIMEVASFTPPITNVNTGTQTGSQVNPPNQIWQSFTTTAAGQLFSIQWDFDNLPANGGYVAKLYLGNGIGGTLLATVPASGSGSPATLVIDFTSVLPALANATQYTIQITPNAGTQNYTLATLTGYSGGNAMIGPPASFPVRVFTGNITNYFSIDNSGNAQFLNTVSANISGNAATATLATTATTANGVASHSVTNAGLSQMPANTVKANITVSTADASDVTIAQLQTALNTSGFSANQILYGGANGVIQGNANLTFNAALSTVLINGSGSVNPTLLIGPSNNCNLGYASTNAAFFTNSLAGDVCLRQSNGASALRLGAGSNAAEVNIADGLVTLTCPLDFPQTQGGSPVSGALITGLEYFEENTAFTTNTTGALVIASLNIKYTRINRRVFMSFQDFNQNAVASSPITFGVALPARLRPSITKQFILEGQRGSGRRSISVQIDTAGIITIFGDETGGNFNNGQIAAYFGQGFSFDV